MQIVYLLHLQYLPHLGYSAQSEATFSVTEVTLTAAKAATPVRRPILVPSAVVIVDVHSCVDRDLQLSIKLLRGPSCHRHPNSVSPLICAVDELSGLRCYTLSSLAHQPWLRERLESSKLDGSTDQCTQEKSYERLPRPSPYHCCYSSPFCSLSCKSTMSVYWPKTQ